MKHKRRPAPSAPAAGHADDEAGADAGLSFSGPVRKPGLDLEGRAGDDRPRERTCLCCGKLFISTGWHNRLCNPCRQRSD